MVALPRWSRPSCSGHPQHSWPRGLCLPSSVTAAATGQLVPSLEATTSRVEPGISHPEARRVAGKRVSLFPFSQALCSGPSLGSGKFVVPSGYLCSHLYHVLLACLSCVSRGHGSSVKPDPCPETCPGLITATEPSRPGRGGHGPTAWKAIPAGQAPEPGGKEAETFTARQRVSC